MLRRLALTAAILAATVGSVPSAVLITRGAASVHAYGFDANRRCAPYSKAYVGAQIQRHSHVPCGCSTIDDVRVGAGRRRTTGANGNTGAVLVSFTKTGSAG